MASNPFDRLKEDAQITSVAKMRDDIKQLKGARDTWSIWGWVTGRLGSSPPALFLYQVQVRDDATGETRAVFGEIYTQRIESKRYASYEAIATDLERVAGGLPIRLNIDW